MGVGELLIKLNFITWANRGSVISICVTDSDSQNLGSRLTVICSDMFLTRQKNVTKLTIRRESIISI